MGRVNERNPLGHSGQRKLHEVVGSTLRLIGQPVMAGMRPPSAAWAARNPRIRRAELASFRASSGANLDFLSLHLAQALERALRSGLESGGDNGEEVTLASYPSCAAQGEVSAPERLKLPL